MWNEGRQDRPSMSRYDQTCSKIVYSILRRHFSATSAILESWSHHGTPLVSGKTSERLMSSSRQALPRMTQRQSLEWILMLSRKRGLGAISGLGLSTRLYLVGGLEMFGTFFCSAYIGNFIILTDELIFFRGVGPNHCLPSEESLDFGLFTSFPRPLQLLVQCVPVFWVTLLAMRPGCTEHLSLSSSAVRLVAVLDPLGPWGLVLQNTVILSVSSKPDPCLIG